MAHMVPDVVTEITYALQYYGAADLPPKQIMLIAQSLLQTFVERGVIEKSVTIVEQIDQEIVLRIDTVEFEGLREKRKRHIMPIKIFTKELALVTQIMTS